MLLILIRHPVVVLMLSLTMSFYAVAFKAFGMNERFAEVKLASASLHVGGYCVRQSSPSCHKLFPSERPEQPVKESRRARASRLLQKVL